ncbi:sensor histidine kinase [Paenibacillus nasutitermitis]|uniref:Histidine kinase n=1 Tax=Paenibacillus nasutitermitis TaxID=1652958 RepID=A0A916YM92_9BACL|nr:sensor histidine kinase [Paenibacillus nasutitermitis]GGD51571.1 histidine kinase [Paenibacillus nasutitermitis]
MIRVIIRGINDLKLRTKLILSFIVVVFVPVMIVGLFLTNELRNQALQNALEQTAVNVDRVKKRTSEVINAAYDISYLLSNDSRLARLAATQYETVYDVVKAYKEYPDIREYINLYKEISNIRIYMNNPTLLDNWEFIQPDSEIMESSWYQSAMSSSGLIGWNYLRDERDGKEYLSLIRKIDFLEDRSSAVLVINVNSRMLDAILKQETFETMIVDEQNNIISSNRPGRVGRKLADLNLSKGIMDMQSGTYDAVVNEQSAKIRIETLVPLSSLNGIRILSVFSVANIVKDANEIIILASIVIFISLIVAIVLIYGFSALLTKRMLRLSKHISKVATGNFDVTLAIDGKDEIGQLSRQFNAMVWSINELLLEVKESNQQKTRLLSSQNEIKFKMLASQINPHFLFNALESIRMKAHIKGEKEIANVVRLLGRMMRKNLEAGSRAVTLKSEIEVVRCYLEIQKFRYEDRLNYELLIDPLTQQIQILPLIIQPLVENAVIHGLENSEYGGSVRVKAALINQWMHIEVSDDGEGMDEERLDFVLRTLEEQEGESEENNRIGLRNVHMRLQLSYGSEHGLAITSAPGCGTQVKFTIPIGGGLHV